MNFLASEFEPELVTVTKFAENSEFRPVDGKREKRFFFTAVLTTCRARHRLVGGTAFRNGINLAAEERRNLALWRCDLHEKAETGEEVISRIIRPRWIKNEKPTQFTRSKRRPFRKWKIVSPRDSVAARTADETTPICLVAVRQIRT